VSEFLEKALKTRSPESLSEIKEELEKRLRARIDELHQELKELYEEGGLDPTPGQLNRVDEITAMIQGNGDILETFFPSKESKREPIKGKIY